MVGVKGGVRVVVSKLGLGYRVRVQLLAHAVSPTPPLSRVRVQLVGEEVVWRPWSGSGLVPQG